MEIVFVDGVLTDRHKIVLANDSDPAGRLNYKSNRGIGDIMRESRLDFDPFKYLKNLCNRGVGMVEVLEGGCGYGYALAGLRRGINAYGSPGTEYFVEGIEGLWDKIHTTGVTLCREHADVALREGYEIDVMIVGAIEHYSFDRCFDLILDSGGPIFYFPQEVIPLYSRILKKGGLAFVTVSPYLLVARELFKESGLEVADSASTDFLLRRNEEDNLEGF